MCEWGICCEDEDEDEAEEEEWAFDLQAPVERWLGGTWHLLKRTYVVNSAKSDKA